MVVQKRTHVHKFVKAAAQQTRFAPKRGAKKGALPPKAVAQGKRSAQKIFVFRPDLAKVFSARNRKFCPLRVYLFSVYLKIMRKKKPREPRRGGA